ncbi:MAG: pyruvate dehydrogenase (acetyl-transferring), homodimeric type [Deltaproteobacteria bacterium]|nr:pyruvate dehydrogenase (acetyl-transferring), homodimeric type [Deltaproteobacteria bacterium]MBT4263547.1 pyruvate dehydrogenase (acetyl-transferring), homodimeric type [Deltaproteobacteria bacterium]MBT4638589.1 pyruvate dehydrogenase (acetyl-transferring), homodimeric type [Deltaproteobacteria bacterium]MBT7714463.1 pyruvate dehydrogenase (acetyl-transferring), homodimeric type [Deltaproteobacteria bacterium]
MAEQPKRDDIDPLETQEWLDALESVLKREGPQRAHFILDKLIDKARRSGTRLQFSANTAYLNTIPLDQEEKNPGDLEMESRILALIRWNAMAMVIQANRSTASVGGHIASFASSAALYEVGFNHFFHAPTETHGGDLLYIQGHCAPGIYARSFLEGRLTEEKLHGFRREISRKGLSSYPHPWLSPDYWQFPTVSMGLGPMLAIYQARFMKYLENRHILNSGDRKVWAFMGDGEMDEPESLGAVSLAAREKLDNLIFVINCNLQRLDGPVRGNSKIIQELEADFHGHGWNVIKLVWSSAWDPLFEQDDKKLLRNRLAEVVDGDFQNYIARGGGYTREHLFGAHPDLMKMVAEKSDEDIWRLYFGGHDVQKVYAAYAEAVKHKGQPTVILAKTVKGFGMGISGEGQNITHQQKKMGQKALKSFRDRFNIPISDADLGDTPFFKPADDSPEMIYLQERRKKLGGFLPQRTPVRDSLKIPDLQAFASQIKGTGDRENSTTMAFVRMLNTLMRDKELAKHVVPIVSDEARTFGMEGMFRQFGIYAASGQLYEPMDSEQVMYYREDLEGQMLEEGITEAGAFSSWIAAGTSGSNHGIPMIPFYIYYSMFGFQRCGDLAWLAGDAQANGFLIGGTSGRTTLEGEGLQHQDGHSHILASTIPNCITYDPTYAYELAVILHDGLQRMYRNREKVFYYITVMNENYTHPPMPEGVEEGICKGIYLLKSGAADNQHAIQLLGCGAILREVLEAGKILEESYDVSANVWSVTSFTQLRRDGLEIERYNRLHPESPPKKSYVDQCLAPFPGPIVASTDYIKSFADQLKPFISRRFIALGTDGFGRSDDRESLRAFFEVDRYWVVVSALKSLADEGKISTAVVTAAMQKFNIDPEKPSPTTV